MDEMKKLHTSLTLLLTRARTHSQIERQNERSRHFDRFFRHHGTKRSTLPLQSRDPSVRKNRYIDQQRRSNSRHVVRTGRSNRIAVRLQFLRSTALESHGVESLVANAISGSNRRHFEFIELLSHALHSHVFGVQTSYSR